MLIPLGKKIIIRPIENESGPLILTQSKPNRYSVVRVGDEVKKIQEGDIIYLEKFYGAEVEHEKEKFLVIEENSVLAKVDKN